MNREKKMGEPTKMAERRVGTLGAWGKKKNKDGNWISFRSGRGERVGNKKGEIQAQVQIFEKENGWRWVHQFASEGLGRREGTGFSLCGWVEQEALIRHVWAEVILDVSHTPAGQLVLGQVQAEAAQLENCGLGFRSL